MAEIHRCAGPGVLHPGRTLQYGKGQRGQHQIALYPLGNALGMALELLTGEKQKEKRSSAQVICVQCLNPPFRPEILVSERIG